MYIYFLSKQKLVKSSKIAIFEKLTLAVKQCYQTAHCAFLCVVLSEVPEYQSLPFRVGMFGMQMTRLSVSKLYQTYGSQVSSSRVRVSEFVDSCTSRMGKSAS